MVSFLADQILSRGRELALAVDAAQVSIEAAFWKYEEDHQRWRLRLASPQVGSKGPLAVYEEIRIQLGLMSRSGDVPFQSDDIRAIDVDDEEVDEVRNLIFSMKPGDVTQMYPYSIIWTYGHQVQPASTINLVNEQGKPADLVANLYRLVSGLALIEVADIAGGNVLSSAMLGLYGSGTVLPIKLTTAKELPTLSITKGEPYAVIDWVEAGSTRKVYMENSSYSRAIAALKAVMTKRRRDP